MIPIRDEAALRDFLAELRRTGWRYTKRLRELEAAALKLRASDCAPSGAPPTPHYWQVGEPWRHSRTCSRAAGGGN